MSQDSDRSAAMKVLDVLEALSGYAVKGVANTALAKSLGLPPSAITRAMNVLIEKGWARKDDATGHFHPTGRMGHVFGRVLADIDRAQTQLDDVRRNFSLSQH